MGTKFDLLGDPVPNNWGERGRPEHIVTGENAIKVKVLLAVGWSNKRIANALGCTVPTLRKHYFSILQDRDRMRDRLHAAKLTKTVERALDGDTSALRLMDQMIAREELEGMSSGFANSGQPANSGQSRPVTPKQGKKAQQKETAQNYAGRFATPPAPGKLN